MSYKKWITVSLEHSYFADGNCRKLRFEPTGDCRERMRRGKQFFYPLPNGFIIFKDPDLTKENLPGTAANCFFDIAVYSADPLFGRYSNLEIDYRQGRVYYIGNTLEPGPGNSEKRLTLSNRQEGLELEAVPVLLKPGQFVIPLDGAAPGGTARLLDKNNAVVRELQVNDKNNGASLSVDVSRKGAGIYSLEINGIITGHFYVDDGLVNTRPAMIIGIAANGEEKDAVQRYDILAASRAVTWEYHVFAYENRRKLDNLEIRNNNEKILPGVSFPPVRSDEEQKEAVFVSNRPIPLSERPVQSIELIEKGSSGSPLVSHLPNAGIDTLHYKEGKWISRINVYI